MAPTLDLPLVTLLTTAAGHSGSDLDGVLRDLKIEVGVGTGYRLFRELPLADMVAVLGELERRATRVPFPFAFARVFNFDGQPEIAAFLASAGSMRETTRLFDWIPRLIHPALRFERADDGIEVRLTVRVDDPAGRHADAPVLVETISAVVVQVCRLIDAGADQALLGVQFGHAPRAARAAYEAFYGGAVSFAEPGDGAGKTPGTVLRFDSPHQYSRLPGSLPVAHARAEETIRRQLAEALAGPSPPPAAAPAPTTAAVVRLLEAHPALIGQGVEAVAARLHVHPRTLQRRLRAEGQTFNDALLGVRHRLACAWLRDTRLDIDSIGEKLGYYERRSFTQAFRRWQGQTPSAYRRGAGGLDG